MESSETKLSIPVNNGNSSVKRVFSPVHVSGGKTIFTIGGNIFEGNSEGIVRISSAFATLRFEGVGASTTATGWTIQRNNSYHR